jgi:hypothetical protein
MTGFFNSLRRRSGGLGCFSGVCKKRGEDALLIYKAGTFRGFN